MERELESMDVAKDQIENIFGEQVKSKSIGIVGGYRRSKTVDKHYTNINKSLSKSHSKSYSERAF